MKIVTSSAALAVIAMSIAAVPPLASPAGAVETGQILDRRYCEPWPSCKWKNAKKGKTNPNNPAPPSAKSGKPDTTTPNPSATANDQLCGLPYTPPCRADAPATDIETGQLLIKDKPVASRKSNNGWVLPTIGAAAALGAIFAVSAGGNDRPTSP